MRSEIFLALLIFVSIVIFAFSACQTSNADNTRAETHSSHLDTAQIPKTTPTPNSEQNSSIRKVDFKNFTYPTIEDYEDFTLENGKKPFKMGEEVGIDLDKIEFYDLIADSEEEAILTLSIETGGTESPHLVYIYTLKNKKSELLWGFMTGDRASGGLKRVYVESGELIVETFGDNKFENDKWEFDLPRNKFTGYCCPSAYTKIRFKWNGEKFVVEGEPELFDYDYKNRKSEN